MTTTKKKQTARRTRRAGTGPRTFMGYKIIDAEQALTFVPNRKDCERGVAGDPQNCAAATCLKRELTGVESVHVGRAITIVVFTRGVAVRFKTPHALRDQELRYDASDGKRFDHDRIFTLLPVPQSYIKQRGRQHSPPDRGRGDPNSPKRRQPRQLGRPSLLFNADGKRAFK